MRYKFIFTLGLLFAFSAYVIGQDKNLYSIDEIILQAQSQSPRFKLAQTQKELSYNRYLTYKSDLKPQISLYGNLPVYSKTYTQVVQPNGAIDFLPVKQNISNTGISLTQKIGFTGGDISFNSELSRFDNFRTKYFQYNGTPFFIRLNQPLFGVNELKWDRKIEPLKLEESKRTYVQEMENIAQQAVKLYFDVLDAQTVINVAEVNLLNTGNNLAMESKRVNMGTTTEDKLLQLELQMLNSRQNLEKAKYTYQVALLALKSLTGSNDSADYVLKLPDQLPVFSISIEDALSFAKQNRSEVVAFQRKKLEAEKEVAIAKAAKQQINLSASFGLNRASENLGTIYSNPQDQQLFSVGFNVPIVDWGRRSSAYNTAKSLEKLSDYNNQIDEINLNQEITTLVKNFNLIRSSIQLAKVTDSVAQRRFTIANSLYQTGKLTVTDLNIAQSEKDNAKISYISALRNFWDACYLLRRLTLFDFQNKQLLYK